MRRHGTLAHLPARRKTTAAALRHETAQAAVRERRGAGGVFAAGSVGDSASVLRHVGRESRGQALRAFGTLISPRRHGIAHGRALPARPFLFWEPFSNVVIATFGVAKNFGALRPRGTFSVT